VKDGGDVGEMGENLGIRAAVACGDVPTAG
jgi:hypothetical protein